MKRTLPCVLMRAGTSRGPFFLREWLPQDEVQRDEALIGAIGASDLLQLDGVGGGSTLTSKVAIVSRSAEPGCDVDYLFAQVGVGQRSVDTRPNCGNMLSGVAPFAIEQGLVDAADGETTVRVFNVNTRSRIDVTVQTPERRVTYEGDTRLDGVAGTAAPIRLDFLDAWGAVTGSLFPTGRRVDRIDGVEVTCIDAAMPMMIVRAVDLGVTGGEPPGELDAIPALLERLEFMRCQAGMMMGLGDVSHSVIPKPVLVSAGDGEHSLTSRYFTPRRCHASHAVTGAVGIATAFALPGTVASSSTRLRGRRRVAVLHPQGRIEVDVDVGGEGDDARVERAALVRTARKILQGELYLPDYVFSRVATGKTPGAAAHGAITIVVPTSAGGGNDTMARAIAAGLAPRLGQPVRVDNRPGANGSIASEFVAHSAADGTTLMLGYIGTHAMSPALHKLHYDPRRDFEPIGLVATSPTLLVIHAHTPVRDIPDLLRQLREQPNRYRFASAGSGTAPHFAAELFMHGSGTSMFGIPYPGAAPALDETILGRAQIMFPSLFSALPHLRAGRLRALAVAGPRRVAALPDVPTLAEAGVEGVDVTQWYALFAPAATPDEVIARTNRALNELLCEPLTMKRIEDHGAEVRSGTPDELRALVDAELHKWRAVMTRSRIPDHRAEPEAAH
ncbi:4-oxalomesaconate tautomerase [uncultured Piscinibacter sp.]|uniref:4-oxalomesaconate tautomerase n=1 Tax=uncultured Piscinibacter sp. TaxID=1131835 RepID=UPI0026184135|nr:4-oxalomesaconate tautomerase [uncultured Piscinibacter sp.]